MKTTEVLAPEALDAMPDAELLLRIQRLKLNIASLKAQIAEFREGAFGRRPDWTTRAEGRLNDLEAARQQIRDEGLRRVRAARGTAA